MKLIAHVAKIPRGLTRFHHTNTAWKIDIRSWGKKSSCIMMRASKANFRRMAERLPPRYLILNVKERRARSQADRAMKAHSITNYFFLDQFSVPDQMVAPRRTTLRRARIGI